MTDPVAPEPTPYSAPAGGAVTPKRGLSLTSFILGIVSVVLFWTSWFAIIVGIVAVVLGFIGKSREPGAPRWMWLTGIVLGFVGIVIAIIVIAVAAAILSSINNGNS